MNLKWIKFTITGSVKLKDAKSACFRNAKFVRVDVREEVLGPSGFPYGIKQCHSYCQYCDSQSVRHSNWNYIISQGAEATAAAIFIKKAAAETLIGHSLL